MRRKARCRWASAARRSSPSRPARAAAASRSSWAWPTLPADALQPAGEQQAGRPVPGRGLVAGRPEGVADPGGADHPVAQDDPGPAEPVGQPQPEPGVVPHGPGEGGVDVGPLGPDQGQALGLGRTADFCAAAVGGVGEPGGVGGGGVAGQPGLGEAVAGEGADAVQEPVAGGAVAGGLDAQHGPVGQPGQHVGRGRLGHAERGHGLLGRGHRRPAGEAGQGPQSPLVVGEQLVVAPGDGRGQGPAPLRAPAGRVLEQAEAVVEAPGDLGDRQRLDPGGGQLDGQGQAVEGAADRLHGGGGVAVEGEAPPGPGRPVGEQGHRVGQRQRLQGVDGLAVDPQRGLAGGQDPQRRGAVQQPGGQVDDPVEDVLAVVQDEHGLGRGQAAEQGLLTPGESQGLGHQPRDRGGGVGHLQPDQPDAAARAQPAHGLQGGAGLADSGRPDQGDQAAGVEQPADAVQVLGPADQGVETVGRLPTTRAGPGAVAAGSRAALWRRIWRSRSARARPGSMPSSSASSRRTRRPAASASACRPARYRAVM